MNTSDANPLGVTLFNELVKEAKGQAPIVSLDAPQPSDALYNDREPNRLVAHEQPLHRIMIMLVAQGHSYTEVARLTGVTIPTVSNLMRQSWARARLLQEVNTVGRDAVQELLKSAGVDSVMTLIEVRDDRTAPPSARATAANSLLDRLLGKPVQTTVNSNLNVNATPSDLAEMEQELARLRAEEEVLRGTRRN